MTTRQNRRSFMSTVTSVAGIAALGSNGTANAQTAAASKWDLAWVDDLKGKHMQVYDMLDADRRARRRRSACHGTTWTRSAT